MSLRFFLFTVGLIFSNAYASCDIIDDANHKLHIAKPAQRMISLAPDITETIFAIGAGQQLVGVISGSNYPEAAKKIPSVGSYTGLDVERMIALQPDVILVWGNMFARQMHAIKKLLPHDSVQIYYSSPKYLHDIPRRIKHLGCLSGKEASANQIANQIIQHWNGLAKKYQHQQSVRVFFQIGSYSLMTINKDSLINQAIEFCGGKNVFAQMSSLAAEVSWENIVIANPDIILSDAMDEEWKQRWQKWPNMKAVQRKLLFSIPPDLIERASPRFVQGMTKLCAHLQQARISI